MFRQSNFDRLLEKATSNLIIETDWETIIQICDLIRQNDVQPRAALTAVKKKMQSTNPHSAMFAVEVLESMVKNCGSSLHDELATRPFCEGLHELVKTTTHENVRNKMLELIQAWTFAFRKNPKYYNTLKDTMNAMKADGYKFPTMRESDAMFSAVSAPVWSDGEVCHRCRTQFSLVNRKHHCRACGQVFCGQCSSKTSTLPKFGIEKEVRVCDACFDQVNKPQMAATVPGKDIDMEEYLKSSLAQQSQAPPRKTEEEIREEEELQLALALSQSEAEAKEKEKLRATNAYFNVKTEPMPARIVDRSPSPPEENTELARYLNRSYWENRQNDVNDTPASPSAPSHVSSFDGKMKENGLGDNEIEEFVNTLRSQVEIFINRMKSNSSRGRSIANDSSVQTLFMNITAMHSKLLRHIQQHDDSRLYYERLQDKLTQIKDARAALDALREEHREKLRKQAEEAERQRQMLMAHKLDIMRKKKQEYLQYQRQIALQRIQEQEREMQMRQEQQKQQYIMGNNYFMPSPVHAQQFPLPPPPNSAPYASYQYAPPGAMMQPPPPPQSAPGQLPPHMQNPMMYGSNMVGMIPGGPPPPQQPPNQMIKIAPPPGILPPGNPQMMPMMSPPQQYIQQPGAPPASPQMVQQLPQPHQQQQQLPQPHQQQQQLPQQPHQQQQQQQQQQHPQQQQPQNPKDEQTAELISFD